MTKNGEPLTPTGHDPGYESDWAWKDYLLSVTMQSQPHTTTNGRIHLQSWRREIIEAVLDDFKVQGQVLDYLPPFTPLNRSLSDDERRLVELAVALREGIDNQTRDASEARTREVLLTTLARDWGDGMGWTDLIEPAEGIGAYESGKGRGRPKQKRIDQELDRFWRVIRSLQDQIR